ncbi:MAG: transcriptional regulator [Candidatus Thorarchaeota archaeon]|jgi:predicted transcriptional regulator
MSDSTEIVYKALVKAGKPLRPGEVAEMTGVDKVEVSKIIKILKKDGRVISPKRCFWAPA